MRAQHCPPRLRIVRCSPRRWCRWLLAGLAAGVGRPPAAHAAPSNPSVSESFAWLRQAVDGLAVPAWAAAVVGGLLLLWLLASLWGRLGASRGAPGRPSRSRLRQQARRAAGRNDLLEAGRLYEAAEDVPAAADAYERAQAFREAAVLQERQGQSAKAARLYEAAGQFARAADLLLKLGNPAKAAALYQKAGEDGK
ncbi:MAG: hypothetical protein WC713_02060, partial [Candidatus Methylomirabilota bacterium]